MERTATSLPLPDEASALLRALGYRRALALSLSRLTHWAVLVSAWLTTVGVIDRAIGLGSTIRAFLLTTLLGTMLVGLARLFRQLVRECRNPVVAARSLRRSRPALSEQLLTLIAPAEPSGSTSLLQAILRSAADDCSRIRADDPLPLSLLLQPLRRLVAPALLLAVLMLLPGIEANRALRRQLFPFRPDEPIAAWSMEVSPGDVAVPTGTSLRIEVRPRVAAPTDSIPLILWESGGLRRTESMRRSGVGFSFVLLELADDVRYEISWNGVRSPAYVARVVRAPAARSIEARLLTHGTPGLPGDGKPSLPVDGKPGLPVEGKPSLPVDDKSGSFADAGMSDPPKRLDLGGNRLAAPVGSRVELVVESTSPLDRAALEAGSTIPGVISEDGMQARFIVAIERNAAWRIVLVGRNGLQSDQRLRIEVTALPDEPPTVRTPRLILRATPGSSVHLPFFAADDHGVVSLLCLLSSGGAVQGRELPLLPTARAAQGIFDSGPLSSPPGTVVWLQVAARDARGLTARSERVGVLVGDGAIDAFDPLRPPLLSDAARQFADAAKSLRTIDNAVRRQRPSADLRDTAAEQLRQAIEQLVAASTDADDPTRDAIALLADTAVQARRTLLELPLEPAQADELDRLRVLVERCHDEAARQSRSLLARLLAEDLRSASSFANSAGDVETRRLLDAAARQRRRWTDALHVRLDDANLLEKLQAEKPGAVSLPGMDQLLTRWRAGASADEIADRLLLRARIASLAREPDVDVVADAVRLSRAVRSAGRAPPEERDASRDRVLLNWDALLEARSVGAFFAEERARRWLRVAGNAEPLGRSLQALAEEAAATAAPLLDLAEQWRALEAVSAQLSPEDLQALRRRLDDDARTFVPELLPDEPADDPATWERAARRRSAMHLRSALWRSTETARQFRLLFSNAPGRTDSPATLPQRLLRLLSGLTTTPETTASPNSAGYDDAVRTYFRLLNRTDERPRS